MTQSGFIAGILLAAFVLYVASKGHLVNYTAVLWGPKPASANGLNDNANAVAQAAPGIAGSLGNPGGAITGAIAGAVGKLLGAASLSDVASSLGDALIT